MAVERGRLLIFLRSVQLRREALLEGYPFSVPVVQSLDRLTFHSPVTLFVGENGSGKSTLLEAIAAGVRSVAVGGADIARDENLQPARELAQRLRFSWTKRTHRGFFLRAEDVFNFGRRMAGLVGELGELADEFEGKFEGYGQSLARGTALEQQRALLERYGRDLNMKSHGESFLHIFGQRFVPGGLYLLDEPDTPLSPQRQLAFLSLLKEMVAEDSQFIIATHSPILMAFPSATILSFDGGSAREVSYGEVEQVELLRAFLADPSAFLRHL